MDNFETNIAEYLEHIPCSSLSYQEWINVGMALKLEGYPCSLWESWSRSDSRFKEGECARKWDTFDGAAEPVTAGTIIQYAKDFGYDPASDMGLLDWDDEIGVDKFDLGWVEPDQIEDKKTDDNIDSYKEIVTYLDALFEPDEKVNIVMKSFKDDDGKYKPSGYGMTYPVKTLLKDLKKHQNDICAAIGDYDPAAGAWVRFNPMDGKGVKNDNVTAFRYALIESDELDISMQSALIKEMRLPVAVLVNSGGKSLHAIVRVNAPTKEIYKKRIDKLYTVCLKYKFKVDTQNKNASRLSRLPGIKRNGKWQYIVDTNIGCESWEEWEEWIDTELDELPDLDDVFIEEDIPEEKEIIKGVLREGRKLLITGPSKIGKSMLLMELSIELIRGSSWFGLDCSKSKVLYVDCELAKNEFKRRMFNIAREKDIPWAELCKDFRESMKVWRLRGISLGDKMDREKSVYLRSFFNKLIRRIKKGGFNVVIIDPIYKILRGDENDAGFVIEFCNHLDRIYKETGAATIFCHHNVKNSGSRDAIDRSSGTGVFARDPDAIIDFAELMIKDEDGCGLDIPDRASAWRAEFILREFREPAPIDIVYNYPLHYMKPGGFGDSAVIKGKGTRKDLSQKGTGVVKDNATKRRDSMESAFDTLTDSSNRVEFSEYLNYFREADGSFPYGYSERTIKDVIKGGETKLYFLEKSGKTYVTC